MVNITNSYINKYIGVDRASVYDILQKIGTREYREGTIKEYKAVGLEYVKIDGNTFSNYGQYQFIWEKTFIKSPERSAGGNIGNLNSYATFLTPHLIMDFSVMSIEDYRAIMKMHYERNEFTVECYDPIYNRKIKVKMYFATEEMAKLYTISQNRLRDSGLWEEWVDLVGVREYKVELIGTNNDLDLVSVFYKYNAPTDASGNPIYPSGSPVSDQAEEDTYIGEEIIVGNNSTFPTTPPSNDYVFKHWTTTPEDTQPYYTNGNVLIVNEGLTLYAQWQKPEARKLSYNYGLSTPEQKGTANTGEPIYRYDDPVKEWEKIPALPKFDEEPTVEDKNTGEKIPAYEKGGWYKHPIKDELLRVKDGDFYWLDRDTIIYLLYDKKKFTVTYAVNDPEPAVEPFINIETTTIEYGETVYLPNLYKPNYNFGGWYIDSGLTTKFTEKMPPYNITLSARWVKK